MQIGLLLENRVFLNMRDMHLMCAKKVKSVQKSLSTKVHKSSVHFSSTEIKFIRVEIIAS